MFEDYLSRFRLHQSTETAPVKVYKPFLMALDNGLVSILILLNLTFHCISKYFNCKDHDTSLVYQIDTSLLALTFPCPHKLVMEFYRDQCWGPILFTLLYILLFCHHYLKAQINVHCYADDTHLY